MSHYQDIRDSIDPDAVTHTWECDTSGCNATIEEDGTYSEAWVKVKEQGWRCRLDASETWCHYCPEHARK